MSSKEKEYFGFGCYDENKPIFTFLECVPGVDPAARMLGIARSGDVSIAHSVSDQARYGDLLSGLRHDARLCFAASIGSSGGVFLPSALALASCFAFGASHSSEKEEGESLSHHRLGVRCGNACRLSDSHASFAGSRSVLFARGRLDRASCFPLAGASFLLNDRRKTIR